MPPQHPQAGWQKATPAETKAILAQHQAQQGFFNALKPQSNLFPSTSRINVANPQGQAKRAALVVPPAPHQRTAAEAKAELDANMPHAHSVTGAVAAGAHYVEQNPVRSAAMVALPGPLSILANPLVAKGAERANVETQKGLAHLQPSQGTDLSGAASTNAGILEAARGVNVASLSTAAQAKLRTAEAFFAQHPTYKYDAPNLGLYSQDAKKKAGLPPTATDADVLRKAFEPFNGHRGFVSTLIHNIPGNAAQLAAAPVGAAYLLTHPISGGKEFAKEQVQFGKDLVEHPLRTLRDQPVTTATTLFGVGRTAGGLAGTVARTGVAGESARAFATPAERNVIPAGQSVKDVEGYQVQPPAINRGMTSPKVDERIAQAASDWASSHIPRLGKRLVRKNANTITKGANQASDQMQRLDVEPAIKAASKLRPAERRAVEYAHGQGIKPSEMADYFEKQAAQNRGMEGDAKTTLDSKGRNHHAQWQEIQADLDKAATLWRKTADNPKIGGDLSVKGQAALETSTQASRAAEAQMTSQHLPGSTDPLISPETMLRRAYVPLSRVRGINPDDPAAVAQLRNEFRASKGAEPVAPDAPLDLHDPLYFPHVVEGPRGLARIRSGQGVGITSENIKPRYAGRLGKAGQQASGELFAQGRASSDPAVFFGAAAKPAKISAALKHLQDQVSSYSIKAEPGMTYDTSKWIRLDVEKGGNVTNVHTTADVDKAINDASSESLKNQLFAHFKDESAQTASVPTDNHEYVLVSKPAYENMQNQFKGHDGALLKAVKNTTAYWRWATLMARPAWLVNNIAGNTVQAGIAGAGPVSFARALRTGPGGKYEGTIPTEAENAGFFRNDMSKPQTGIAATATKPIHAFTKAVVGANVKFENWARRAVAIRNATTEGKAAVHGEVKTIRSNFHATNNAVREAMRNPTPEAHARVVKEVDRALGNFNRVKATPMYDAISPFHRWFEFIGKYVAEMPAKTPGRALFLQRLGQFGINVQSQAFGGFIPNSLQGAIQLPQNIPGVGGLYKTTQGLNPLATPFQLLAPTDQSSTDPGQPQPSGFAGAFNPLVGAAYNFGWGKDFQTGADLKDQYNTKVGGYNPNVLIHALENSVPFTSLLQGYGTADTSTNPISPDARHRSALSQPQSGGLARTVGYFGGSVKPFDPTLNQVAAFKRLMPALKTEARNRAKNG